MAPPATLTDLFPEQPANHASSQGRRARAVRSLFFGKERAPSESVLGVRAVPLFPENPRRTLLGNRASGIRASRKPRFYAQRTLAAGESGFLRGGAGTPSTLRTHKIFPPGPSTTRLLLRPHRLTPFGAYPR